MPEQHFFDWFLDNVLLALSPLARDAARMAIHEAMDVICGRAEAQVFCKRAGEPLPYTRFEICAIRFETRDDDV